EKAIMVFTVGITDAAWYGLVACLISRPTFLSRLRAGETIITRVFGVILIALALSVLANALVLE
ncbi:MAG: LysE family translocator, partial [Halioglobus sp.]|nr:LysE family translocator [Halioglobus sp.]